MEKFTNNRLFTWLVYIILGLISLYLLLLLKPMITHIYIFLRAVFAPFLIAMIISYVLNPIVSLLQ